jgi:hypothetical protein
MSFSVPCGPMRLRTWRSSEVAPQNTLHLGFLSCFGSWLSSVTMPDEMLEVCCCVDSQDFLLNGWLSVAMLAFEKIAIKFVRDPIKQGAA